LLHVDTDGAEQGNCSGTGEEGGEERDTELLSGSLGETDVSLPPNLQLMEAMTAR
jgi:hypothetical protein